MAKQTAVEWLVNQITAKHDKSFLEFYCAEIDEAKAMEREQHSETYNQGLASNFQKFEHYYEQTYGKEVTNEL